MNTVATNTAFRAAARQYDNASPDESDEQPLEEWFDDLAAETRAELLMEFIDGHKRVRGELSRSYPIFGGSMTVYVVNADLNFDFFDWLADRCESMRNAA